MRPTFAKLAALLALTPLVLSVPTTELTKRQTIDTTSHCGQWDTVVAGQYTLYLDQWGSGGATSGSDCASLTSLSGTTIAWTTTWSWTGGTGVKSFTNIALDTGLNVQLSAIKSMPATWKWSQSSTGTIVADIAFDIFTSATSGGSNAYEIMIWLANYNAGPISYNYDSSGNPVAVATGVSLAGQTWNVYYGSNGANYVYSFLPASGSTITSFSGDLYTFFQYLISSQGLSSAQYLTTLQAGTEATSGSATLTTSAYSAVVSSGASSSSSTTSSTTSKSSTTTSATKTTTTSTTKTSTTTSSASTATQTLYGQCGGTGWTGPTACASGSTCTYSNPYYSQCLSS